MSTVMYNIRNFDRKQLKVSMVTPAMFLSQQEKVDFAAKCVGACVNALTSYLAAGMKSDNCEISLMRALFGGEKDRTYNRK